MHNETLGGDARLAIVDDPGLDRGLDRAIQVSAGHHDDRIAATKLQDSLFELFAGHAGYAAAGPYAAGKRDGHNAGVGDDFVDAVRADQQSLKNTFGKTGLEEDF